MADPTPTTADTALLEGEKQKLHKSLSRLDMIGFTVCAFVGLDTLGLVAGAGAQGFTWLVVLAVLFVLPYALVMSEVGSAFTEEGGPYEWVKMAFGRGHAAIAALMYWVTNPFWVGGSLAFIATEAWDANIFGIPSGSVGDYVFKLLFIWFSIGVAIASLQKGKWIPNVGALLRVVVLGGFTITLVVYAIKNGVHGFPVGDLSPTMAVFLALVPVLLFNYVGFELQNGAAEEMQDPQKDVPLAVLRSGALGVGLYAIPVFGIMLVLPPEAITGVSGFMDAVATTFTVYGGAADVLLGIVTLCFVGTLLTSGAVWMIGSDRIQAVAAADGAFFPFFAKFHDTLGTPVRVNVLSGVVSSLFMIAALAIFQDSSAFEVVLTIAISTTLISYLWIFTAVLRLRTVRPETPRPYRVPGGPWGIRVAVGLITFWVALGSWVAVFPGTLEKVVGLDYDFEDAWGVSFAKFELLTWGTLACVVLLALVGYLAGRRVRTGTAPVPLAAEAG